MNNKILNIILLIHFNYQSNNFKFTKKYIKKHLYGMLFQFNSKLIKRGLLYKVKITLVQYTVSIKVFVQKFMLV
jgi:hypothetical protein